jgi:predicted nucleic acid-binding protein
VPTVSKRARPLAGPLPGPVYCDASALVKLYLPEPESGELNRTLAGRQDLLAADLGVTEIISSVARRWRDGSMNIEQAHKLQRTLLADLDAGYFQRVELTPATYRQAERFLLSLAMVALRAADALHLALAVEAGALSIVTFDRRLAEAAHSIGMRTAPLVAHAE